jgi:hypothetical protein
MEPEKKKKANGTVDNKGMENRSYPTCISLKNLLQATTPLVSADMIIYQSISDPYQGRISLPLTRSMFSRKAKLVYRNNNQACTR